MSNQPCPYSSGSKCFLVRCFQLQPHHSSAVGCRAMVEGIPHCQAWAKTSPAQNLWEGPIAHVPLEPAPLHQSWGGEPAPLHRGWFQPGTASILRQLIWIYKDKCTLPRVALQARTVLSAWPQTVWGPQQAGLACVMGQDSQQLLWAA